MQFSHLLTFFSLLILTSALVPGAITYKPISHTSPLYNLVLTSKTHSLNNALIFACHEGAGIESLCALPTYPEARNGSIQSAQFRFNITQDECDPATSPPGCSNPVVNTTAPGVEGQITWTLYANGGEEHFSQSVQFISQGVASNVAFPVIGWGENVASFAFDGNGRLGQYDVLYTRNGSDPYGSRKLYTDRWWICEGKWHWYTLFHLVWVYGDGRPTLAGCDKVEVGRVWL